VIPITKVVVEPEAEALVLEVLRSGMLAQGPMVERFEACCRDMTGARHAVAVTNGTVALSAALEAMGVGPGDEVVTTPFTFVATLNAILGVGATVRFADIRADDFNLDPDAVADVISERTAVVLPVHLYGLPADMAPLCSLAAAHGARVLEDAAQAHGATYRGRPVGTFGVATFSFYATKNINAGEGGVVTTDDDEVADRLRVLRNQGMRARYDYVVAGHNQRMTDLAAAVALPQFERLADINRRRSEHAAYYRHRLAAVEGLVVPSVFDDREHVWHQFTLRVTPDAPIDRDELVRRLAERGVQGGVYYPRLVHDYDCYRADPLIEGGSTDVARRVATEVVSIPVHQHLSDRDREAVADAVVDALRSGG
jgi:dTDP-4-amino-4,6-dideoxygalactose transaminase